MSLRYMTVLVFTLAACGSTGRGHGIGVGGGPTTSKGPGADGGSSSSGSDGGSNGDSTYNTGPCDSQIVGQNTAAALTAAIGICNTQYVTGMKFNGPSVAEGRNTVASLGVVQKLEGSAMAFLSNGKATTDPTYVPQPGSGQDTDTGTNTTYMSPYGNLAAPPNGCGGPPASTGNDYEELEVDLTIPPGVNSFSFQFQFFSAEYPEYVCSMFNDRFLAVVDDGVKPEQVAFDSKMNPVTVDSGFFTICQNGGTTQTNNCMMPVSAIMGTGYDADDGTGEPVGGSTGWLTTTVPATPGAHIKLRFIIYDESDDILDSAVLIDNFKWLGGAVTGPVTIQ